MRFPLCKNICFKHIYIYKLMCTYKYTSLRMVNIYIIYLLDYIYICIYYLDMAPGQLWSKARKDMKQIYVG